MSQLANLLENHADAVVRRWAARLRDPSAAGGDAAAGEYARGLLRALAEALRAGPPAAVAPAAGAPGGGGDRRLGADAPGGPGHRRLGADAPGGPGHRCLGTDAGAIVRTYGLLHDAVLAAADEAGATPTSAEVRALGAFFSDAAAAAVGERDRRAQAERERLSREVEAARGRREALVEDVRAGEAQLRLVTDALPVLVSFVTADERYGFVNKAYEDWFGLPREALVGRTLREIVGEAAYATLAPYVRRALAGEHFTVEQRGVAYRLGGTRDIRATYSPYRDPSGRVGGYVVLLEDVTAQARLAEERERLSRQRTEVLESMGDAFFALDREWRFALVNRRYEELSRKGRDETLGRVFWQVFPEADDPASRSFQEYHRCMAERTAGHFVEHHAPLARWTDVRVYPTAEGGISVFFRDVSAERQAAEALRRQAEFEQQLIGIVSHDLRNPLNVIAMSSSLLLGDEDLGEQSTQFVVRIRNAAGRAARLVNDLLDFTQARLGGGIAIERRGADVHAVVGGVAEEVEAAYPGRRLDLAREGDGRGSWDPDRLAQVVQNLVTNALKYSPADTPVRVTSRGDGAAVTLLVHNEGAPIPADKLPVLFEPFQRAVGQIDKASRSVGLGLYIVREVVAAHGGTVTVRSTEAEGTTFAVRLPRGAPP